MEGSHSVEVAISVTETGELADVAFSLPEPCRSRRSLEYLNRTHSATLIDEKVFITVPGMNGDSVLQGKGTLELDGRAGSWGWRSTRFTQQIEVRLASRVVPQNQSLCFGKSRVSALHFPLTHPKIFARLSSL